MKTVRYLMPGLVLLALVMLPGQAQASPISFTLTQEFSGAQTPSGSAPWLTATFTDMGGGVVQLQLQGNLQAAGEFVSQWVFNFNPSLNPGNLVFTYVSGDAATINTGANAFKADGDGFFDIRFSWGNGVFTGSDSATYNITYTGIGGISAADFNYDSAPGGGTSPGPFKTAAHVQGIFDPAGTPGNTAGSGWIGPNGDQPRVPEPGIVLLLGTGLVGLAAYARRRGIRK